MFMVYYFAEHSLGVLVCAYGYIVLCFGFCSKLEGQEVINFVIKGVDGDSSELRTSLIQEVNDMNLDTDNPVCPFKGANYYVSTHEIPGEAMQQILSEIPQYQAAAPPNLLAANYKNN